MLCLNELRKIDVRGPFAEERLCARTLQFTFCMALSVLQILHFACGSAQDDRRQLRSG